MPSPPSRRSFLQFSSTIMLASAGCIGISDIADLRYNNNTNRKITVTTKIQRIADGDTVLSDTTVMAPEEEHRYRNPIQEAGLFRIQISVKDGPENSYKWDAPADESYGLAVWISQEAVEFGELVS